jgi:hypothetical protein
VHSAHVLVISCRFIIVVSLFCLLFDFSFIFFSTFVSFDSFAFSLFVVQKKIFNSDPGLYSRYFDPVVREVPLHRHLCKSINIIHQTAPTLS